RLDISALEVNPDPVMVATEGALWGSVKAHGFLPDTVIVSDDAGQFNEGADPERNLGLAAQRLAGAPDRGRDGGESFSVAASRSWRLRARSRARSGWRWCAS
ncbi:MAG TPA: hypothetical protein VFY53_05925, partial [Rhodoplanes sp.]|nr:hypothetical protein [Rhodoplanes sp.]